MNSWQNSVGRADAYVLGLCFGVVLGTMLFASVASCIDADYSKSRDRLMKMEATCVGMNSTPKSYDATTLTCENGAQISH